MTILIFLYNYHCVFCGTFDQEQIPGRLNWAPPKLLLETCHRLAHGVECAKPRICIAGKNGTKIKLHLEFLEGRLYLLIIRAERI
jgi:hypothetical protein